MHWLQPVPSWSNFWKYYSVLNKHYLAGPCGPQMLSLSQTFVATSEEYRGWNQIYYSLSNKTSSKHTLVNSSSRRWAFLVLISNTALVLGQRLDNITS